MKRRLEYLEKTLLYPDRETWPMAGRQDVLWKLTIDAQMLSASIRAGFAHRMKQLYNTILVCRTVSIYLFQRRVRGGEKERSVT
jgi:hypothetical protein